MSMQTIGPFQLLEELGRGAIGMVFRGFDPAIGRHVAIKIIQAGQFVSLEEKSELKLRFAREATAAGKLSHPNIVTVYHLGEEGDLQYLVLELVNGCSLEKTLSNGQPQGQKTAVSILAQVADALDYAHGEGIVHRDVKPANILVRPDGKAKITDFGIARIASQTITRTGFTFGTPAYMSPEQIVTAKVSGQADQYSLGVIAYQMLSGKRPFAADTGAALMYQIMSEEPTPLHTVNPAVSPRTSKVIGKAMAKKPEDRFVSCREFAEKLSESLNATRDPQTEATATMPAVRTPSGVPAQEPAREERSESATGTPTRRSRQGLWIAAGLAAVGLAGVAWVRWHRPDGPVAALVLRSGDTKVNAKDGPAVAPPEPVKPPRPAKEVNAKDGLTASPSEETKPREPTTKVNKKEVAAPPEETKQPLLLRLLSPSSGEVVLQNQADIGCPLDPNSGYGFSTRFQWEGVAGAAVYHLLVQGVGSTSPLIDTTIRETLYERKSCGGFVSDGNLAGWQWRVEAFDSGGRVMVASETRSFRWTPCRLASGVPCSASPR